MSLGEVLDLGTFSPSQGLTFQYTYQTVAASHSGAEDGCTDGEQGELVAVLSRTELDFLRARLLEQDPALVSVWIGMVGLYDSGPGCV